MAQDNETPLDYRRYAAMTQSLVAKKVTPAEVPAEDKDKKTKSAPSKEMVKPAMPPERQLEALKAKLDEKIDDVKTLTEFIKLGYELGEYDLIIGYMRDYLARKSRDNGIRFNLAMTLMRKGDKKGSKLQFRKILSYDQKHSQARAMLDRLRREE